MKYGFVPALGTPLDGDGRFMAESYTKQINAMVDAGATALLCMGSMGQQAFIQNEECVRVAETAVKAAAGRVPVFVGAMDNSIVRAKRRVASMEHLDLTAFVLTTPYYEVDHAGQVMTYFREVAASTNHGILLYDLPSVTNFKITYDMVCQLKADIPNLLGIKSADLVMLRKIRRNPALKDLQIFYSGLDTCDIAWHWGIGSILDGMFGCTPANNRKLMAALEASDLEAAGQALDNILALRDFFCDCDLWPAYSAAMNLLGFEGIHGPDWISPVSPETKAAIVEKMKEIGEL